MIVADIPEAPYIWLAQAVSFLAFGEFPTADDDALKPSDSFEWDAQAAGATSRQWDKASKRLFAAHVAGAVVLYGRYTPRFDGDPQGEPVAIPSEFLAGEDLMVGLNNYILHKDAGRPIYRDVYIETAKFVRWQKLTPRPPRSHRKPKPSDARDFQRWAMASSKDRTFGPTLNEAEEWAGQRSLNRAWAREQHKALPPEVRRPRGGRGTTAYVAKTGEGDN